MAFSDLVMSQGSGTLKLGGVLSQVYRDEYDTLYDNYSKHNSPRQLATWLGRNSAIQVRFKATDPTRCMP